MSWKTLLNAARYEVPRASLDPTRSEFDRDSDRIIYTSAFRRMQDKTQVFPLSQNDYVRTRLTHSLEVASVGRTLGRLAAVSINKRVPKSERVDAAEVAALVSTACLAHDLGNPPFGHSGEAAIQQFFIKSSVGKAILRRIPIAHRSDFLSFEGNAQGFRIMTQLEFGRKPGGLKLTYASLGTFAKYPFPAARKKRQPETVSNKKHGFHRVEGDAFAEVARSLGLLRKGEGWARHPLAFLVEAADDICYRVIDVEDGFRQGVVDFVLAEEALKRMLSSKEQAQVARRKGADKNNTIEYLRAKAITAAVESVAGAFDASYDLLMRGRLATSLIDVSSLSRPLAGLKRIAKEKIYSSEKVVMVELAGFEVLGGLLELYGEAFLDYLTKGRDGVSGKSRNLVRTLPQAYRDIDDASAAMPSPLEVAHRLADYVSGMTDTFAVSLYRRLKGIDL